MSKIGRLIQRYERLKPKVVAAMIMNLPLTKVAKKKLKVKK